MITVIGAGIIGLSIGWQLARQGYQVQIFEKGKAGKQASWAAAGMLAPYSEAGFENEALLDISLEGFRLFPRFLQELQEDGFVLPEEVTGTLFAALNRDDQRWLERIYAHHKSCGFPSEKLDGAEARAIEPLLSPRVCAGIWIPCEKQIDNRKLLGVLVEAFRRCGGKLYEQQPAFCAPGETTIIAAGIDSPNVHPVKGEILTLFLKGLRCMVRSPRVYIAPKKTGVIRVGATEHETNDPSIAAGSVYALLHDAIQLIPVLAEAAFMEAIVGLRPMTNNRLPYIGPSPLDSDMIYASGHGRAGILLAPYTAYKISSYIKEKYGNPSERHALHFE